MTATATEATTATGPDFVSTVMWDGGWGKWLTVRTAPTDAAEAAAVAFLTRHRDKAQEADTEAMGPYVEGTYEFPALMDYHFPICEHGLSANLCAGPGHYPPDHY